MRATRLRGAFAIASLGILAACAAVPEAEREESAATGAAELDGELRSAWQLLGASESDPDDGAFPCIDGEAGCAENGGLPVGTYTVVEKDVTVNAGDLLVVHAQVSAIDNVLYEDVAYAAWLTCNGAMISGIMEKDLSRWFTNDKNGHHKSGNHHAAVWTTGYCYAKAAGTTKVAAMAKTYGTGLTFGTGHYSPLLIEQYRKTAGGFSGKSPRVVTAPNQHGEHVMNQMDVPVADLVLSDIALERGDVVRQSAQLSAYFPGTCSSDNMFGAKTDRGFTPCAENVMCDLSRVTTNVWGLFTVGTPPASLTSYGYVAHEADSDEALLDDTYANYQALVFHDAVAGADLVDVRRVKPSANVLLQNAQTVTLASSELALAASSIVDLTAHAEVASEIPSVSYRATCSAQGIVYRHGTKTIVASTAPVIRAFSYPYSRHPLSGEALFTLPAGDYDVATNLTCTGSFAQYLTAVAGGSGLAMHVYGAISQ